MLKLALGQASCQFLVFEPCSGAVVREMEREKERVREKQREREREREKEKEI